jgi:hypothetical protein
LNLGTRDKFVSQKRDLTLLKTIPAMFTTHLSTTTCNQQTPFTRTRARFPETRIHPGLFFSDMISLQDLAEFCNVPAPMLSSGHPDRSGRPTATRATPGNHDLSDHPICN